MKKYFEKVLMVMLAAFLSVSFTACSDDDDDDSGKGSMSGWVEIDGKKYDFKYFYGYFDTDGEVFFTGFNKNPRSMKESDNFNMTNFTMAFKSDGTLDSEYGNPAITFEFEINCNEGKGNADMVMYGNVSTSYDGISAKISGKKLVIDGDEVDVRYGDKGQTHLSPGDPVKTISFHFEGTPEEVSMD